MSVSSKQLSAVVPITKMAGNLEFLKTWLSEFDPKILEVIIVHDVQDSETGSELREILANLENKEIIFIENEFGSPGAARNAGLLLCTCPWIAFWDGDDSPLVNEFLKMIQQADLEVAEIAIGGYSLNSKTQNHRQVIDELPSFGEWGSNVPFNPGIWRWAFRREIVQGITFTTNLMGEDQCFLFEIHPLTKNVYIHDKSVYKYTIHRRGQLTRDKRAINEIEKSIKYLSSIIKNQNKKLNYFELIIIIKQSVTAIKKGNSYVKVFGLFTLLRVILQSIFQLNKSIITMLRSTILFVILKRNYLPQYKNILMFGGLGNQLFQLNTGLNIAKNKGLRLNYSFTDVTNSSDTQLSEFAIPDNTNMLFGTPSNFFVKKIVNFSIRVSSRSQDLKRTKGLDAFIISTLQRILGWVYPGSWKINKGVGHDEKLLDKKDSNYLGYFQTYQNVHKYLENEFELLSPSLAYLDQQSDLSDLKSLVVHVRLGDYVQEKYFGTPSCTYFAHSIQELWETGHYLRICLFSNDLEKAITYIPADLVRHVWSPKQEEISDAETFQLMRYGSGYVISNSSFSWWAARLSYGSNSRVICPKPWFKNKEEPHMLIPLHWERRDA
jgi:hypothetical protein